MDNCPKRRKYNELQYRIGHVKRTQKDYSLSFKLQVVQEIELGQLGKTAACHKYGIQSISTIRNWLQKYDTFIGRTNQKYS